MRTASLLPLLLAVACSATNPADGDLAPGELMTDDGLYMIHLTPSDEPFAAGEEVTLGLHVMAGDAGIEGATLTVDPFMPDMGHGIPEPPLITEMDGGMYEAAFTFPMAGYWEVDITVDGTEGVDHAMAAYEVE